MEPERFQRGVFCVSIDFELAWGILDLPNYQRYLRMFPIERQEVLGRLLALFAEYDLSASWCTVGHLFLDRCGGQRGRNHRELIRSSAYDATRLARDPGTCEAEHPAFYGRELIAQILACRTPQEIGSHSFSHVLFGDPKCSRATAHSELEAVVEAAAQLGLSLTSFVYPRNRVGHTDLLAQYGFTCYRSQDPVWYEQTASRRWYHRAAHLAAILRASTPPVVVPEWDAAAGIWAIPGSMLYTPSHGIRRHIPIHLRVARAQKGLAEAVRQRRIFHLWMHPTDLVVRMEAMLDGLKRILDTAARLRSRGEMEFLSMGAIAGRLATPRQVTISAVAAESAR